jgi:hypothetical protein
VAQWRLDVHLSRFLVAVSVLATAAYVWIYAAGLAAAPVRSDGFGYFVYLPAAVVDRDLTLETTARECCGGTFPGWAAIIRWPETQRLVGAHPVGVAILLLPFYVAAHLLTLWSNLPPTGWSFYYQHAAGLGGVAALVAGLAVLGRALARTVAPASAIWTLAVVTFGTNLFHYGTFDSVYSHVFSFLLVCGLIHQVPLWFESPSPARAMGIGAIAAMVVLVRHPNAVALAVIPAYGLWNRRSLRDQVALLWSRRASVALMAATALAVAAPQMAMYYWATGRVVVSSYGSLWFNFADPQLFGVLFSVQKGLFFWAPLLLLGVAGWFLRGPAAPFAASIAVVVPVTVYVIAAWWDWQYGGSFGHRGFTDLTGLFALGIAAVFERARPHRTATLALRSAAVVLIALSVAQMLQYWLGTLPIADLTWPQYRDGFLRFR